MEPGEPVLPGEEGYEGDDVEYDEEGEEVEYEDGVEDGELAEGVEEYDSQDDEEGEIEGDEGAMAGCGRDCATPRLHAVPCQPPCPAPCS